LSNTFSAVFYDSGIKFVIVPLESIINLRNMKRHNYFLVAIIIFLSFSMAWAQPKGPFPEISGTNLKDQTVSIPNDTKGKFTLIGMAYSKKSEDDLITWFNPVYQTFIHKSEKGLFDEGYDVNVYFIPMFTGMNKAAAGVAKKKMRKGSDPELEPHIVFYKGELKKYKETLKFGKKDQPYFFVLDKEGKIIYTTEGAFTRDKLDEVEGLMEEW